MVKQSSWQQPKHFTCALDLLCFQSLWSWVCPGSAGCVQLLWLHNSWSKYRENSCRFLALLEEAQFGSDFHADKAALVSWCVSFYSNRFSKGQRVVFKAVWIFQCWGYVLTSKFINWNTWFEVFSCSFKSSLLLEKALSKEGRVVPTMKWKLHFWNKGFEALGAGERWKEQFGCAGAVPWPCLLCSQQSCAAPVKVTQRGEIPGAAWLGHALAGKCTNESGQARGIYGL